LEIGKRHKGEGTLAGRYKGGWKEKPELEVRRWHRRTG